MQGKDGGWGAFDVDNDMNVLNQLLFGDLESMIDPSTPDLTGRVLELIGSIGYGLSNDVVKRAMSFLKRTQDKEGSWWGRWGVNHLRVLRSMPIELFVADHHKQRLNSVDIPQSHCSLDARSLFSNIDAAVVVTPAPAQDRKSVV